VRIQRENILRDVLPVVDNLERALGAARGGTDIRTVVQGVEMVLKALHDFLRTQGVTPVNAVGETFDPARHEAADHVRSDQHKPNTVVSEFHRGYLLGDRVLRPARVSVSKHGSAERSGGENDASDIENN
jgi:molecular chaperone GrpE